MTRTIRQNRRSAGFSLMLVMTVVAVAAVLGMAILTSNTLQTEASRGQDQALQADALAESGINVGLYYLQNINDVTKCPLGISTISLLLPTTYTESNVSLGAQVAGTYDLKVERAGLSRFVLTSTGTATSSLGNVSRTITATVELNYFTFAAMFNNALQPTTINASTMYIAGDVYSAGAVVNSSTVSGTIYSNSVSGGGTQLATKALSAIPAITQIPIVSLLPTVLAVNHYTTYTASTGATKTAGVLPILPPSITGVTKNPSAANPAGVWTSAIDFELGGGVTINGTLTVTGKLYVSGNNTINARPNFPGLVVDSDVVFKTDGATLTVNGLTYVGGQVKRGGAATANLNVTGVLVSGGGVGAVDPLVTTNITYDRAAAAVNSLGTLAGVVTLSKPSSVSIVSWKNYGTP